MGLTEWRKQRKESVNLKRDQYKTSNLKNTEKNDGAHRKGLTMDRTNIHRVLEGKERGMGQEKKYLKT